MTKEEYGTAYQNGYCATVRFLVLRGLSFDTAQETAQAAWAKGWERLWQLKDSNMIFTWMNRIALNIHRSRYRTEPLFQELPELLAPPAVSLAGIEIRRILGTSKAGDREVLQRYYLEGYNAREIGNANGWTEAAVRIRLMRARRTVGIRLGRNVNKPGARRSVPRE